MTAKPRAPKVPERSIPQGAVLRMAVSSWDCFEEEASGAAWFPIKVRGPEGSIGFCEVFESRDAAVKAYGPDVPTMPIQSTVARPVARPAKRRIK